MRRLFLCRLRRHFKHHRRESMRVRLFLKCGLPGILWGLEQSPSIPRRVLSRSSLAFPSWWCPATAVIVWIRAGATVTTCYTQSFSRYMTIDECIQARLAAPEAGHLVPHQSPTWRRCNGLPQPRRIRLRVGEPRRLRHFQHRLHRHLLALLLLSMLLQLDISQASRPPNAQCSPHALIPAHDARLHLRGHDRLYNERCFPVPGGILVHVLVFANRHRLVPGLQPAIAHCQSRAGGADHKGWAFQAYSSQRKRIWRSQVLGFSLQTLVAECQLKG